mmetsp:Transcript_20823/g.30828  ORF Transcript_20823/g.30828 Transcript_20823/m.30828 type:complete len:177 (-) Transcript_20823:214-744(-)
MSKSSLPLGWEDRNNQMSEHDMKLGGIAATKFASKAVNAYSEGDNTYKTSDDVREFYLNKDEAKVDQLDSGSGVPDFWEERQKHKALEEKQYCVFSSKSNDSVAHASAKEEDPKGHQIFSPEVALVKVTTDTLETLASTFEQNPSLLIPAEDRAGLAKAMKRAMDALSKSTHRTSS